MRHTVWEEFFKSLDRLGSKESNIFGLLLEFFESNTSVLLQEEFSNHQLKSKLSIPNKFTGDTSLILKNSTFNIATEIKKALAYSERVVVCPATPRTCQMTNEDRFDGLTSEGHLFPPTKQEFDGIPFGIGLGQEFFVAKDWLVAAKPLLLSGRLNYIPFVSTSGFYADSNGDRSYDPSYNGMLWHPEIFSLPKGVHREGMMWQKEAISRDWMVADRLGATQLLTQAFDNIAAINLSASGDVYQGLALASLEIPNFEQVSFDGLSRIIEEEQHSHLDFVKAIRSAFNNLHFDQGLTDEELVRRVQQVQKEEIDYHIHRVLEKIKRLEKFNMARFGGYAVASTTLLAFTIFSPILTPYVAGAIGGITLLKLYDAVVNMIEKRNGIIKDDARSFLARLTIN